MCIYIYTYVQTHSWGCSCGHGSTRVTKTENLHNMHHIYVHVYVCVYMYIYAHTHSWGCSCGHGSTRVTKTENLHNMHHIYVYVCIYICTLTHTAGAAPVVTEIQRVTKTENNLHNICMYLYTHIMGITQIITSLSNVYTLTEAHMFLCTSYTHSYIHTWNFSCSSCGRKGIIHPDTYIHT